MQAPAPSSLPANGESSRSIRLDTLQNSAGLTAQMDKQFEKRSGADLDALIGAEGMFPWTPWIEGGDGGEPVGADESALNANGARPVGW